MSKCISLVTVFFLAQIGGQLGIPTAWGGQKEVLPPLETQVEAVDWGDILFNARLRYEFADQDGLEASHALTLRTRLGYESPEFAGFSFLVEGEDVRILGNENNFNQAGLSGPGKTVVADPEGTELNRLQLAYTSTPVDATAGRQLIILDDSRFIGDVGWRQNQQTFDAARLVLKPASDWSVEYIYIDEVQRIFGDDHPAGEFESDSHLLRTQFKPAKYLTATGFGYLIRLDDAPALSGDTWGMRLNGKVGDKAAAGWTFDYELSAALQFDNRASTSEQDFLAEYLRAEAGASVAGWRAHFAYERLGEDNGRGFQTPLATLHKFNGWADVFLTTPASGLQDFMAGVSCKPTPSTTAQVIGHEFTTGDGDHLGWEVDASVGWAITKEVSALAKIAHFEGNSGYASTDKVWLQMEVSF